jgi:hypothetical protein
VPVIAVFTKYDQLVNAKMDYVERKRPDLTTFGQDEEAKKLAKEFYEVSCVECLVKATGNPKALCAKVSSTSPVYLWCHRFIACAVRDPLSMVTLVQLTSECVGVATPSSGQIGPGGRARATTSEVAASEAVQLSWDIAQRADIELKIDASIRYVVTLS